MGLLRRAGVTFGWCQDYVGRPHSTKRGHIFLCACPLLSQLCCCCFCRCARALSPLSLPLLCACVYLLGGEGFGEWGLGREKWRKVWSSVPEDVAHGTPIVRWIWECCGGVVWERRMQRETTQAGAAGVCTGESTSYGGAEVGACREREGIWDLRGRPCGQAQRYARLCEAHLLMKADEAVGWRSAGLYTCELFAEPNPVRQPYV